jgi:hypothetical protein
MKDESLNQAKSNKSVSSRRSRSSKPKKNIVKDIFPATDLERGLIGWEGQDDPMHPRWVFYNARGGVYCSPSKELSRLKKMDTPWVCQWHYILVVSRKYNPLILVLPHLLSPLCSSVVAPGIPIMNEEFHNTSSVLSTLTVSIFVLGFVVCINFPPLISARTEES